uniref:Ubiquitin-like domain-containing protein n=1 Tax=Hemiselmis andersenii TaxID=464988 RepID=A0A6T8NNA2_HEMAN|mmetsp:Transcript_39270/g.91774  ORF Transcript_39270/g.91774 Transcript_39270/m.91774 type:complete len:108 (-) Transcript_39270:400-723(-)
MSYQVKFMFADAVTTECEFPAGVGVLEAKGKLLEAWPAEKEPVDGPASMRMIYGGKVLEDSKKFEDYKIPTGQKVIMHLQPKPPQPKVQVVETPQKQVEQTRCCTIL